MLSVVFKSIVLFLCFILGFNILVIYYLEFALGRFGKNFIEKVVLYVIFYGVLKLVSFFKLNL